MGKSLVSCFFPRHSVEVAAAGNAVLSLACDHNFLKLGSVKGYVVKG